MYTPYVTLYLIRGTPGSGKSSLAEQMYSCGMVGFIAEADDYFTDDKGEYKFDAKKLNLAHNQCQAAAKYHLEDGFDVAVSNTSTTEAEVETYRKIAEECNARFVSLVVESRHDAKNIHGVPPEKVEQMRKRFSVKV